jgi:methionyl-tRNA formyltransferase
MKIIFFGNDNNSLIVLDKLFKSSHSIELVVTSQDKVRSRGTKKSQSTIKEFCLQNSVSFTEKIPTASLIEQIKPDVFVVASFGKIIPKKVIDFPKYGSLNIHPSLLPKYRGPSPVISAILNGDKVTGVSIISLNSGIDSGPIILQKKYSIGQKDSLELITQNLFIDGTKLILNLLANPNDIFKSVPQDESKASATQKILKSDGHINWNNSAQTILNQIRAIGHNPGTYSYLDGKKIKIHNAEIYEQNIEGLNIGEIFSIRKDGQSFLLVKAFDHIINILLIQPESRPKMTAQAYLSGHLNDIGKKLD